MGNSWKFVLKKKEVSGNSCIFAARKPRLSERRAESLLSSYSERKRLRTKFKLKYM